MIYYKKCKNFMKWNKPIYFYTVACIQNVNAMENSDIFCEMVLTVLKKKPV